MRCAKTTGRNRKEKKMNDMKALDELIKDAVNEEKALATRADELALQSKQFAD